MSQKKTYVISYRVISDTPMDWIQCIITEKEAMMDVKAGFYKWKKWK
jgi:hypothetical protein